MRENKRRRLEKKGWKIGTAEKFLRLSLGDTAKIDHPGNEGSSQERVRDSLTSKIQLLMVEIRLIVSDFAHGKVVYHSEK